MVCKSTKFPLFIQKLYHLFAFIMLKMQKRGRKMMMTVRYFKKKV